LSKQILILIFYSAYSCICSNGYLLDKVGKVASHFRGVVDFDIVSTDSVEASQYSIKRSCILVYGKVELDPDCAEEQLIDAVIEFLK